VTADNARDSPMNAVRPVSLQYFAVGNHLRDRRRHVAGFLTPNRDIAAAASLQFPEPQIN
jgi:hypothetical protein